MINIQQYLNNHSSRLSICVYYYYYVLSQLPSYLPDLSADGSWRRWSILVVYMQT